MNGDNGYVVQFHKKEPKQTQVEIFRVKEWREISLLHVTPKDKNIWRSIDPEMANNIVERLSHHFSEANYKPVIIFAEDLDIDVYIHEDKKQEIKGQLSLNV